MLYHHGITQSQMPKSCTNTYVSNTQTCCSSPAFSVTNRRATRRFTQPAALSRTCIIDKSFKPLEIWRMGGNGWVSLLRRALTSYSALWFPRFKRSGNVRHFITSSFLCFEISFFASPQVPPSYSSHTMSLSQAIHSNRHTPIPRFERFRG